MGKVATGSVCPIEYYRSWSLFEWIEWKRYYQFYQNTNTYGLIWAWRMKYDGLAT